MVLSIIQYIYENPSFTFSRWLISNLTTVMDRPHQNTHSIKILANYMVGKGVKLKDVIFHIVHLHLLLLLL